MVPRWPTLSRARQTFGRVPLAVGGDSASMVDWAGLRQQVEANSEEVGRHTVMIEATSRRMEELAKELDALAGVVREQTASQPDQGGGCRTSKAGCQN